MCATGAGCKWSHCKELSVGAVLGGVIAAVARREEAAAAAGRSSG